jgi:hypothetical protein
MHSIGRRIEDPSSDQLCIFQRVLGQREGGGRREWGGGGKEEKLYCRVLTLCIYIRDIDLFWNS